MWLEYIRYRFRMDARQDWLQLVQVAALEGLRHSPRCRSWRVMPAPGDPSHLVLEIEWDPGTEPSPFRGSEEFAAVHAALALRTRSLEEADYRVATPWLRRLLGRPDTSFRMTEDIVMGILEEPDLGRRFASEDGSRRGRLGLWLLEVLGGPDLFSSSFPDASLRDGPLPGERLDLEERERLLEIASKALPSGMQKQGRGILDNLRAHLPLHPRPPSPLDVAARWLGAGTTPNDDPAPSGLRARVERDDALDAEPPASGDRPPSGVRRHPRESGVIPCPDPAAPITKATTGTWQLPRARSAAPTLRSRAPDRWALWRFGRGRR